MENLVLHIMNSNSQCLYFSGGNDLQSDLWAEGLQVLQERRGFVVPKPAKSHIQLGGYLTAESALTAALVDCVLQFTRVFALYSWRPGQ